MAKIMTLLTLALITSNVWGQTLHRQELLNQDIHSANGQVRVAFFDADSTLRVSLSGSVSANSTTDVMLLPQVENKIAQLIKDGYFIAIVSNQGGIKAGAVTHEIADGALYRTIELIRQAHPEARIHYFDYAEGSDEFRKPERGMADRLEGHLREKGLSIDWKNSFMVGDSAYKKGVDFNPNSKLPGTHFSNSDRLFAENLKIPFYEPTDFFGWRQHGIDVFDKADQVREYQLKYAAPLNCGRVF